MARRFHIFRPVQSLFGAGSAHLSARIGRYGEARAGRHLRRKLGFEIVHRNWRNPGNRREEIDLVCRDKGALVFVEVKTRAEGALVSGFHAVDRRKRRALGRAIRSFLALAPAKPKTFRLDVVEVETGGRVLHFRNVELFSKHYRP